MCRHPYTVAGYLAAGGSRRFPYRYSEVGSGEHCLDVQTFVHFVLEELIVDVCDPQCA